jgi:lysophospholipase L1-like esterase
VQSGASVIPKTNWSLSYVDSQELVKENGAGVNVFDGNTSTIWHTQWYPTSSQLPHEIQINLGAVYTTTGFRYLPRQDGGVNGRIGQYEFYVSTDGVNWGSPVATGTFANTATEKEVLFTQTTGQYIRLRALSEVNGKPWTSMSEINVLGVSSGNQAPNGVIDTPGGNVTINVGGSVNLTGTGIDQDGNLPLTYLWNFGGGSGIPNATVEDPGLKQFNTAGIFTVNFTVTDALGLADPTPATRTITVQSGASVIPHTNWSLVSVDSQELVGENGAGVKAFDGNVNTRWHTKWFGGSDPLPHEIQINLGAVYNVSGFRYLPNQINGRIKQWEFYVSNNTSNWGIPVATGTFANDATEKEVLFTQTTGQYIRLRALSEVNGNPWTHVAEINVLGGSSGNQAPNGVIDTPGGNMTINVGGSVNFTGTGSDQDGNLPLAYLWNFGGGSGIPNATVEDPGLKQFNTAGIFTVSFTVTDALGLADPTPATRIITVQSGNQPPNSVINTPSGNVTIPQGGSVNLTGTGTDPDNNTPLTYRWNFGNAGIADSMAQNPGAVTFNTAGTFAITFTVTDALGLSDYTPVTRIITVLSNSPVISRTNWSLRYVDSEELVGENGAAVNAFDGNTSTIWHTKYSNVNPDPPQPHEIQINLGAVYDMRGFRYLPRQDGRSNGRIARYEFYVSTDGTNWDTPVVAGILANGSMEKEVLFTPTTGQFVRLKALTEVDGFPWTAVAEINVLGNLSSGNRPPNSTINTPSWHMTINVGTSINCTGNGTDPDNNTPLTYRWNFGNAGIVDSTAQNPGAVTFNTAGTFMITFTVTDALGRSDPTPAIRVITVNGGGGGSVIPHTYWSLWYVDSEELVGENGAAINAFDGNVNTIWHTKWFGGSPPTPHEIQIDLGAVYNISGMRYLPRQDGEVNGRIGQYAFYVSMDGINWGNPVAGGTFANDVTEKEILFNPTMGRFVRLLAQTEVNGNPWTSMAEINVLHGCQEPPSVQILQPQDYHLQKLSALYVFTQTCLDTNLHVGWGVKFTVDGGPGSGGGEYTDYISPFEATFSNLSMSEHVVDAFIVDTLGNVVSGNMTHDRAVQIGIGDYYVAVGDSITFGIGDNNFSDDNSLDGRNTGGGYTPILNDLLAQAKGYPHTIVNEGIPGDTSAAGVSLIPSLLNKHPYAQRYLVQYGTNDAGGLLPVPSGKGLNPGNSGYTGSFKDKMKQIITLINNAGKEVCLAKVPITRNSTQMNILIQDYNIVIDELKGDSANRITVIPPDFYTYFATHSEEFADNLHPDGIGYHSMANLWSQSLTQ